MPPITDTTICECRHVFDEHEEGQKCTVEGCGCVYFEPAENQNADE